LWPLTEIALRGGGGGDATGGWRVEGWNMCSIVPVAFAVGTLIGEQNSWMATWPDFCLIVAVVVACHK